MFTGKRPNASGTSDFAKDIDPAVERLVARCLDTDPRRRPQTALNVAMGLPGADPIAAALAAGETPSPEMVAASQEKEGFSSRAAIACFLATILGAVIAVTVGSRENLLSHATLELPPEALTFQAQQILRDLGYDGKPADTASGFIYVNAVYRQSLDRKTPAERDAILATHQPPVIAFWYRQHVAPLESGAFFPGSGLAPGVVTPSEPANDTPGMIRLRLDPKGRLERLEIWSLSGNAGPSASQPADWNDLFRAAGLDPARFSPAEPEQLPPVPSDERAAFIGTFAEGRLEKVRVEAGRWQGRPVYFNVSGDWAPAAVAPGVRGTRGRQWAQFAVFATMLLGAALLAWRNLQLGRGDRRGALWVGGLMFMLALLSTLFRAAFVPNLWALGVTIMALSWALFFAALAAALYLGIEPLVRRNFPDALISLSRLQGGRFRDSLVASHVLAGLAARAFFQALNGPVAYFIPSLRTHALSSLPSLSEFFGFEFDGVGEAILAVTGICLVVVLLRLALLPLVKTRLWIADVVAAIPFALGLSLGAPDPVTLALAGGLNYLGICGVLWALRRFGLLTSAAFVIATQVTNAVPPVLPSWWSGRVLLAWGFPIAVAAWALWVVLTDKRGRSTETAS